MWAKEAHTNGADMKASELIEELQATIEKYGDLQVALFHDEMCRHFDSFVISRAYRGEEGPLISGQGDLAEEFISLQL